MKAFEAKLEVVDGGVQWTQRDLADADLERVTELAGLGLSVREIAEETGIPRSTVQRLRKRAESRGSYFAESVYGRD